ncbi:unnamed protein product, partial [Ectocarpus sp. 6 AP-2014]
GTPPRRGNNQRRRSARYMRQRSGPGHGVAGGGRTLRADEQGEAGSTWYIKVDVQEKHLRTRWRRNRRKKHRTARVKTGAAHDARRDSNS